MTVSTTRGARTGSSLIVALCGMLILFDGYDLVVYGNVVPSLLAEPGWGLTPVTAGRIASLTSIAMAVGAVLAGSLADRIGRRRVVMISLVVFSLSMAGCALAPSATVFEVLRALGGLGLGAMFPSATALVVEFARPGRQAMSYSLAFFGYLFGGIAAAGLGLLLIEPVGWRVMFWIGALPLLLLPVLLRILPESPAWLVERGRTDEARAVVERFGLDRGRPTTRTGPGAADSDSAVAVVFARHYRLATCLLWLVQSCSLFLVFGIVTWLPTMMKAVGYSLGAALTFALILNVGGAVGAVLGARSADRRGARLSVFVLFATGAAGLVVLAMRPPSALAFLLICLAGAGTLGVQILVNTFGAALYPVAARGAGLGWALGVGRSGAIVGPVVFGALLATSSGAVTAFYVLAAVAAAGGVLAAVLPLTPAARVSVAELRTAGTSDAHGVAAAPPAH
jgi:MFS transporter, AAHS family, benzoate transport protein